MSIDRYATLAQVEVVKWGGAGGQRCIDNVAEEVPVALEYNGISHAVMLASPADLEDFALGFSLTEGIVECRDEIYECETTPGEDGIRVALRISAARFAALKEKRRNLTGRTGCGLCGTESLQHAIRTPSPVMSGAVFSAQTLHEALIDMQRKQDLQLRTGATHAAAWVGPDGGIHALREDVGRHNALDKLIGCMAAQDIDFGAGAALVTSRASYEMVQKAALAGIGIMVAVSAPTALAVRLAEECGLTLIGFMREQGHVVYTHPDRLIPS